MQLSEYCDDDLLEEVKHRGFEIKVKQHCETKIMIGGVTFDVTS